MKSEFNTHYSLKLFLIYPGLINDHSPEVSRHELRVSERLLDLDPVLVVLLVVEVAPVVREARHAAKPGVEVKLETAAGLNRSGLCL